MIGETNLLPASCRETFERQRNRRRWIVAYCAACVLIAVLYSGLSTVYVGVDRERDALRDQVQERLLKNEEATALLSDIRTIEERLKRYNDLAWPVRMTEVIDSIAVIVPDGATLTALTLAPRTDRIRIPAAKGKKAQERVERKLTVELQGIAPDDFTVSGIVSGLDANPMFRGVSLDFARQRLVDGVEGREFRVQAEIDLDTRYLFEELVEAGATP
ncbi:MAG: hypothetical protein Tsb0013_02730 [Phycisphaerales bacterium]